MTLGVPPPAGPAAAAGDAARRATRLDSVERLVETSGNRFAASSSNPSQGTGLVPPRDRFSPRLRRSAIGRGHCSSSAEVLVFRRGRRGGSRRRAAIYLLGKIIEATGRLGRMRGRADAMSPRRTARPGPIIAGPFRETPRDDRRPLFAPDKLSRPVSPPCANRTAGPRGR